MSLLKCLENTIILCEICKYANNFLYAIPLFKEINGVGSANICAFLYLFQIVCRILQLFRILWLEDEFIEISISAAMPEDIFHGMPYTFEYITLRFQMHTAIYLLAIIICWIGDYKLVFYVVAGAYEQVLFFHKLYFWNYVFLLLSCFLSCFFWISNFRIIQ